jgi:hypothetical protein
MMTIFGSGIATGKYAMASSQPLGSPSDFADTTVKAEMFGETPPKATKEVNKVHGESSQTIGKKRKRADLTDVQTILLTNMGQMTEAVNSVATAIRETKAEEVHPDLYGAVMYMPGFTDEARLMAFSHLLDNKALGIAFVGMSEEHRILWLRTFLTKHYYGQ